MERIETAKIILNDSLVNKKKSEELFDFIMKVIQFEDEMIKMRHDYATEKFVDAKYE